MDPARYHAKHGQTSVPCLNAKILLEGLSFIFVLKGH
jgi:hypothetical protein